LEKNILSVVTVKSGSKDLKKAIHNIFSIKKYFEALPPILYSWLGPKNCKKIWFQKSNYILYIQTLGVFKKQPEFQTAVEAVINDT
jgi:hypothetical protein